MSIILKALKKAHTEKHKNPEVKWGRLLEEERRDHGREKEIAEREKRFLMRIVWGITALFAVTLISLMALAGWIYFRSDDFAALMNRSKPSEGGLAAGMAPPESNPNPAVNPAQPPVTIAAALPSPKPSPAPALVPTPDSPSTVQNPPAPTPWRAATAMDFEKARQDLKVMGIFWSPVRPFAVVNNDQVHPDQWVKGYRVLEIQKNVVVFLSPDNARIEMAPNRADPPPEPRDDGTE